MGSDAEEKRMRVMLDEILRLEDSRDFLCITILALQCFLLLLALLDPVCLEHDQSTSLACEILSCPSILQPSSRALQPADARRSLRPVTYCPHTAGDEPSRQQMVKACFKVDASTAIT
jgi:hypothetical protein